MSLGQGVQTRASLVMQTRLGWQEKGSGLQARAQQTWGSGLARLGPDFSCARGKIVLVVATSALISSTSVYNVRTKSGRIRRHTR